MNILNGIDRVQLYPDSPCQKCLVKMTCTISIKDRTACPEYINYILDLVKKGNKNEKE